VKEMGKEVRRLPLMACAVALLAATSSSPPRNRSSRRPDAGVLPSGFAGEPISFHKSIGQGPAHPLPLHDDLLLRLLRN
jgi:hypothetical protein